MVDFKSLCVSSDASIKDALSLLDQTAKQILLVVSDNFQLIGTLTDGDVRRGLLRGLTLSDEIKSITNLTPVVGYTSESKSLIIEKAVRKKISYIPVLNGNGTVVDLINVVESKKVLPKLNKVVLMVGGLGTRLYPLTQNIPKPMLMVGDKPILHTIVEWLASHGFVHVVMCVNYKADIIESYFQSGEKFGVHIEYIYENKRMGTAGALGLLNSIPEEPFIVMNGDLLTNMNLESLIDYHIAQNAVATMCVREYESEIPFGVVSLRGNLIQSIVEKPVEKYFVSAGIYVLSPGCLSLIPNGTYYDMPSLFQSIIARGDAAVSFPIYEYWLDIGRLNEYEQANKEYGAIFGAK